MLRSTRSPSDKPAYVTPAGTTQTYTGSVTEVAPVATISGG